MIAAKLKFYQNLTLCEGAMKKRSIYRHFKSIDEQRIVLGKPFLNKMFRTEFLLIHFILMNHKHNKTVKTKRFSRILSLFEHIDIGQW